MGDNRLATFVVRASLFALITVAAADPLETGESRLLPYKKNYLLFYSFDGTEHPDQRQHREAKFQISLAFPLRYEPNGNPLDFAFAYTQRAYWQVYDGDGSRPFRAIDHNPEFFLRLPGSHLGATKAWVGYEHDSNGEALPESLSMNRLYLRGVWERESLDLDLKVWHWLMKKPKKSPDDPYGEEMPDAPEYYGYGELWFHYRQGAYRMAAMVRNNLRSGENRGAVQMDLSGPMKNLEWYVQYFNGYGESLADYRALVNRIGAGIQLSY